MLYAFFATCRVPPVAVWLVAQFFPFPKPPAMTHPETQQIIDRVEQTTGYRVPV